MAISVCFCGNLAIKVHQYIDIDKMYIHFLVTVQLRQYVILLFHLIKCMYYFTIEIYMRLTFSFTEKVFIDNHSSL